MKGTILQFDTESGQGLIEDQRGAQFPFDLNQVVDGHEVAEGDTVSFRPKGSKRGPFAARVMPVPAQVS